MLKNKKYGGFTLLEMLVVVLIIGILAGIALPQYEMAVTKAKVASILPIMRRWYDALAEYKLQHGSYEDLDWVTGGAILGVTWPSDWKYGNEPCGDRTECGNDYWSCFPNEEPSGYVYCGHDTSDGGDFAIYMYQPDDEFYPDRAGMMTCETGDRREGHKVCKALGGKLIDGDGEYWGVYKLN